MNLTTNLIRVSNLEITEIISNDILLKNESNAIELMSEPITDHIILYEKNFEKIFFDLSSRIAGDVLQKFSNYFIKVAIVGDFDKFQSKALKDFIFESNRLKNHLFVKTKEDAIRLWQLS